MSVVGETFKKYFIFSAIINVILITTCITLITKIVSRKNINPVIDGFCNCSGLQRKTIQDDTNDSSIKCRVMKAVT